MSKIIIGRKDKIDIPTLSIENISVKIDSGAYSSSIHCSSIELVTTSKESLLEVIFLDENNSNFTGKIHSFKNPTLMYCFYKPGYSGGLCKQRRKPLA